MYFTNITNEELQTFHKTLIGNFTIKATDTTNNPLFHTEQNTPNIYKIIPLFNTKDIHSTNPEDKIIENKIIITNLKPDTYYTFTSNPEEPTKDYTPYGEYYNISNTLTMPEFNRIIQYIRESENSEDLRLTNGIINGVYGDYTINIEDATITDQGILITKQTVTSPGTITLTNPVYQNSTYKLTLKVFHITDVNIMEEYGENHKVTEELTITLIPDTPVHIPYETLDYGYTILLPAIVNITHDKPVITGVIINNLLLETSKGTIQVQEPVRITATVTDIGDVGIPGKTVTFTITDLEGTIITTLTCTSNSQGIAYIDYTGAGNGFLEILAECGSKTGTGAIIDAILIDKATLGEKNSNWTNYSNRLTVETGDDGTLLTGYASSNGYYIANASNPFIFEDYICEFDVVSINGSSRWYHQHQTAGNENVFVLNTWINGPCHVKIAVKDGVATLYVDGVQKTTTNLTITAPYEVAFRFNNGTSNTLKYKNFIIYPGEEGDIVNLSLSSTKDTLSYVDNDTTTLTATVTDGISAGISGEPVTFKIGTTTLDTVTTDSNGVAEYEYTSTGAGDISIVVECRNLQETYEIEDCIVAVSEWQRSSSSSSTTLSKIVNDSFDVPSKFVLDFDYKGTTSMARTGLFNSSSSENYNLSVQVDTNDYIGVYRGTSTTGLDNERLTADNTVYHNCKIIVDGTTVTWLLDNTNSASATVSWVPTKKPYYLICETWKNGGTTYVQNLKLKPL